ncbi:MAG: GNAT family N-acetyltransferase [Chthonomonas sp.]|nr:GNAT family N-acetyltransferase [Chthonomonas sp.]
MSRLTFRNWDPQHDAEAAFKIYSDIEVVRYLGCRVTVMESVEMQRERLQKIADSAASTGGVTGFWAACLDGEPVGSALFKELPDGEGNPTGDFEIGWHLRRDKWGQGLGTQIAAAMLELAHRHVPRVLAIAYPQNLASLRVMEKIGMQPLGLTSQYYGVECIAYESSLLARNGDNAATHR